MSYRKLNILEITMKKNLLKRCAIFGNEFKIRINSVGFDNPHIKSVQVIFVVDKVVCYSGLELARVPRVPGNRRNSEHHLWHPRKFLILTGTRRAHSM